MSPILVCGRNLSSGSARASILLGCWLLTLFIELFLLLIFDANMVFQFCYHNNLNRFGSQLVLQFVYIRGSKCRWYGTATTFWSCNFLTTAGKLSCFLEDEIKILFYYINISLWCVHYWVDMQCLNKGIEMLLLSRFNNLLTLQYFDNCRWVVLFVRKSNQNTILLH